jgi:large subunit ribosomal protein L24
MKIVKGDIVYLRAGKDVANNESRLHAALGIKSEADFQRAREKMTMAQQVETANKENGVRGKVIRVYPVKRKLLVEGLNMVMKHQKAGSRSGASQVQQGGRMKLEAAIPLSRVMLVCPHCDKPTRVGIQFREDTRQTLSGSKVVQVRDRVCKHCSQVIARPTDRTGL